ncbi:MAG: M48 family metallopeptidase [Legionella sp.]|nr:M48 family metallopeptidase [Legionella sp.]
MTDVIITRKKIKNLILRVTRDGQVKISAPHRCPKKIIDDFLAQKQTWIAKQQSIIRQHVSRQPPPTLTHQHRQQMKEILPPLFEKWEAIIGVKAHEWGVKAMKTRWGSCNTVKKRIWINLHLIHKPRICLEYVLVHELVHLLEASHNQRFYALMTEFMPDWKAHRQLLKTH